MKKIKLTAFFFCLTSLCQNISFSQNTNQGNGNQQWKMNGNIADENHYFGTKNQFPLKFRTNDLERIRITEDGNFGIGTSTPASKLDVNGSAIFRENLQLPNLDYVPIDDKEIIIIDNNGNLKKASHEQMATYLINALYNSSKNCLNDYLANPTWMNGPKKIYTKCPDVFVGVNTITPRVNLDVIGTSYTNRLVLGNLDPSNINTGMIHLRAFNENSSSLIDISNSSSQNIFKIASNGKVTIGRLAQVNGIHSDALFTVSGKMVTQALYINMDNWADFVFDDKYELPKLNEIEEYYKKHKHLPNIPSEEEVLKNGIELGEMNKLLLQKIEELTLLLVDQSKQIEILKAEMIEIKN